MSDVPRIVQLADVSNRYGGSMFDLRRKWARNGWFLRLRVYGRMEAFDIMLAAQRLGFACSTPIHEAGGSYQMCVTVPDEDAATLRHAVGTGAVAAIGPPRRELPR